MSLLRRLLSSFSGILLAIIGVLSSLLLMLGWRNSHNKAEKEIYKRQVEKAREILDQDTELGAAYDSDLKRLRDAEGARDYLRNPNSDWLRRDD